MKEILFFCIWTISSSSFAAIDNNQHGGHGLFQGLEEIGKSAWLEEPKLAEKFRHVKITPEPRIEDNSLVINVAPKSRNDLLENSDSKFGQSSLYLQPEPRGLQYMLNTADFNPFLGHFMKKRDINKEFVSYPNGQGPTQCQRKRIMCALRNKRNTNFQDAQTIPGSRGQSVLFGVPNVNQNFPGVPGNLEGQIIPGSRGQAVLYGIPNYQGNIPTQNVQNSRDGPINYGYKTHGY